MSVSYTHLDVYKRQGYYIVNYFTKEGLGLGYVGFYSSKRGRRSVSLNLYTINDQLQGGRQTNLALGEPVSYTHLDVYKRQLAACLPGLTAR